MFKDKGRGAPKATLYTAGRELQHAAPTYLCPGTRDSNFNYLFFSLSILILDPQPVRMLVGSIPDNFLPYEAAGRDNWDTLTGSPHGYASPVHPLLLVQWDGGHGRVDHAGKGTFDKHWG